MLSICIVDMGLVGARGLAELVRMKSHFQRDPQGWRHLLEEPEEGQGMILLFEARPNGL